jgi:hypothetical protein
MKGLFVIFIFCISIFQIHGQVYSNSAAKAKLREWGIFSSKIIEDAETIVVESGEITRDGGLCISLPIFEFVNQDNIVLLRGASGYIASNGKIIIEAELLYISAIVIRINNRKYLIVGQSLKDIVNYLLE